MRGRKHKIKPEQFPALLAWYETDRTFKGKARQMRVSISCLRLAIKKAQNERKLIKERNEQQMFHESHSGDANGSHP